MMKKYVIAILLMIMLCSIACARMPQVGDSVSINVGFNGGELEGTITDIENGLICLDRTDDGETDTCIGIGSIRMLSWVD